MSDFQTIKKSALSRALVSAMLWFAIAFSIAPTSLGESRFTTRSSLLEEQLPPTSHTLAVAFARNVLIKFLLSSYGKDETAQLEALSEAESIIERFALQPRSLIRVETKLELEKLIKQQSQNFMSLSDELQILRGNLPPYIILSPANRAVESEIERVNDAALELAQSSLSEHTGGLRSSPAGASALSQLATTLGSTGALNFHKLSMNLLNRPRAAREALARIPESVRLEFIAQFHSLVTEAISEIDNTGRAIANSDLLKISSPGWERFFQITFGEYFRHLSLETKLNIVSSFIDVSSKVRGPQDKWSLTALERFKVMVMNAGPQFQKLMQIYARQEGFGDELKGVLKELESSTKPIPFRLVRQMLQTENLPFDLLSIDEKPLGVGTMAQVHRARIRTSEGDEKIVVIRVLKPDILSRVQEDSRTLEQLAILVDSDPLLRKENFPLLTPFLEQIEEMTAKETNIWLTTANQAKGAEAYRHDVPLRTDGFDGTLEIRAPEILDLETGSKIMVQDFAEGASFERFSGKEPQLAKAVVEELARIWIEETLLGSGFFHADLHQGNLRVLRKRAHRTNPNREKNETASSLRQTEKIDIVRLTLLDFGMTGQLSTDLQNQFIALGIVVSSRDPDIMAKVMWELSDQSQNKISRDELKRLLDAELERQSHRGIKSWPMYEWVALAVNGGLRFSAEFTTLNRGVVLIFRMIEDHNSSLDLSSTLKSLLLRSPKRLWAVFNSTESVGKTEWARILWRNLTAGESQSSVLPRSLPGNSSKHEFDEDQRAHRSITSLRCETLFSYSPPLAK